MMNLPNSLTLLRVAFIPVFIVLFYLPFSWSYYASAAVFILAAITDWLDGFLARQLQQMTKFGAFLDPVADKLIVVTALILLLQDYAVTHPRSSIFFALAVVIIIGREIVISALREWMAELGSRASVAVSMVGKLKTTLQMVAIIVLLAFNPSQYPMLHYVGVLLVYVAAGLTLWSMIVYLKAAWPDLMGRRSD